MPTSGEHKAHHGHHRDDDAAQITAEQKAKWDNSSQSYADVLISKGVSEPNSRQVLEAVLKQLNAMSGLLIPPAILLDVYTNG